MATMFRIAIVALDRVKDLPTAEDALRKCQAEYRRSGSLASIQMVEEASAAVAKYRREKVAA